MLADYQIQSAVDGMWPTHEGLNIKGFNKAHLNPSSYDLTLSSIVRPVGFDLPEVVDVACVQPDYTYLHDMEDEGFKLLPGEFLLGASNEVVELPLTLSARVEGKSSLGRIGLAVHITAGFIDPGFHGSITLEIVNMLGRPIILRRNMRIAQIAFTPMSGVPAQGYGLTGHYQNQGLNGEPIESRYQM
jgi:dCTP deaminase